MSAAPGTALPAGAPRLTMSMAALGRVGHALVWISVFSGAYVIREPAPYDLLMIATLGIYFLCGLSLYGSVRPLTGLLLAFTAGGFLSLTQAPEYDPFFFIVVSAYLAATGIFFAAFVSAWPERRAPLIMNAYLISAVCAALVAITGWLAGNETLALYGRASGTFKDPNVFGAFLVPPACYALMLVLARPLRAVWLPATAFVLLCAAIFVTFSRGAWGSLAVAGLLVGYLCFVTSRSNMERTRLVAMGAAGLLVLLLGLVAILSIERVSELFTVRASLDQSYDVGHSGRFSNQVGALRLIAQEPLGIGALQFATLFSGDPHNVYLNAFLSYSWLGGIAFLALTLLTVGKAFSLALTSRGMRVVTIPLAASFFVLAVEGLIIDTDHWRHLFLLIGLVWGLDAARRRVASGHRPLPAS